MFCVDVVTFNGIIVPHGSHADKPAVDESAKAPTPGPVPAGMMAIMKPGGDGYILVPGSPDDLVLAPDGTTVLRARTLRGAQIIGAAKNLSAVTETTEPLPGVPDCSEPQLECGNLEPHGFNDDGSVHYACYPYSCGGCVYWLITCTS